MHGLPLLNSFLAEAGSFGYVLPSCGFASLKPESILSQEGEAMNESRKCPECGAEMASNAPDTPCPVCLMKLGLESWAIQLGAKDAAAAAQTQDSPPQCFAAPAPEELRDRFPQFEVMDLLGQGGMGAVYKAIQRSLDRVVALKIIPSDRTSDPQFAERFAREAKALARLNHQNIVTVHDFGQTDGFYYFVMEYVEGVNLREMLLAGHLDARQALEIVPHVCDALQYAHDEGIVHRDIKPENILIDKKGRVKIADFGLAKLMGRSSSVDSLTGTQQVMGTPRYMAPEQMEGSPEVDHRADIYSLGVVFYEMLTGELPLGRFAPPSRKVRIDVRLDEVVLKTLEKEPEQRYQRASEMKTAIERVSTLQAPPSRGTDGQSVLRQMRGPAAGLIATGIANWIGAPLAVLILSQMPSQDVALPQPALPWIGAAVFIVAGLIMLAGLKMMRLQAFPLAVLGSVLAMLVTPGNLIGLPIGIWSLVVLSQREVREAFAFRTPNDALVDCRGSAAVVAPRKIAVLADLLIVVAVLATLTAAGVGLWLWLSPTAPLLKAQTVFTLRSMGVCEVVYATFILASALLIRRMRGYMFVLLCVAIVGIAVPAMLAMNVIMEWGTIPQWPVLIPLWLGMPATACVTVLLFRQDVRGAFQ
jgi:serine/threonine protein kinase